MHADMHRIGVAKQIVHIAEDFLICTHKEHTKIIRLAIFIGWIGKALENPWLDMKQLILPSESQVTS